MAGSYVRQRASQLHVARLEVVGKPVLLDVVRVLGPLVHLPRQHVDLLPQHVDGDLHDELRRHDPRGLHAHDEPPGPVPDLDEVRGSGVHGPVEVVPVLRKVGHLVEEAHVPGLLLVHCGRVHLHGVSGRVVDEHGEGGDAGGLVVGRVHELVYLVRRQGREGLLVHLHHAVRLHGHGGHRVPLCVLLADPLARDRVDLDLLAPAKLDDDDAVRRGIGALLVLVQVHGHHAGVLGDEVVGGHMHPRLIVRADVQRELDGAVGAEVGAGAVPRVVELSGEVALERDEPQAVCDELVVEHRRVALHLHKVDGHGRHFGDHHTAEGVGDGGVHVGEQEADAVGV
mmetsp:Transcript_18277/g.61132  ORF Transcript_18277/g.61132 Transcript_18277/m.61132 type:complete len:341 (-) Transcript_18277:107-1129(-)